MRISDWSSDVCSSDLRRPAAGSRCGSSRHSFHVSHQRLAGDDRLRDFGNAAIGANGLAAQPRIGWGLVDLAALHQDRLGLVADRAFGEGVFRLVDYTSEARRVGKELGVKLMTWW